MTVQDFLSCYIEEKRVEGELKERLEDADGKEKEVLAELCQITNPSANTLRGLLRLLDEICFRDSLSSVDVLAEGEAQRILLDENSSRKEKQKHLRMFLEAKRYPELQKINEMLESSKKELVRDCGIKVELPRELEGDSVELHLRIRSPEDCRKLSKTLEKMSEHSALENIFSVLCGDYE